MANYNTLKTSIEAVIKQNGNNEITGPILQQTLLAMVNSLGVGYQYAGIATPATNPGTPSTAGTYTNFGGLVLADGEIAILKFNGTWAKDSTGSATQESVNQLGQEVEDNRVSVSQNTLSIGGEGKGELYEVIDCPEFVEVHTDSEGKIVFGVRQDGSFFFGAGCPPQVKDYIEEYGYNKVAIDNLINGKVDKVAGKSLIDSDAADNIDYDNTKEVLQTKKPVEIDGGATIGNTDSPEFISVETDSEKKILSSRRGDGTKTEYAGFEVKGKFALDGVTYFIGESPEYILVITDQVKHILGGIKTDGTTFISDLTEIPPIIKSALESLANTDITLLERISYIENLVIPESKSKWYEGYDVCIVGGGAAGVFAAYALKQKVRDYGLKVCIIEKQPYLGGTHTQGYVSSLAPTPAPLFLDDIIKAQISKGRADLSDGEHNPIPFATALNTDFKATYGPYGSYTHGLWINIDPDALSEKYYNDLKDYIDIFTSDYITSVESANGAVISVNTHEGKTIYANNFIDCTGNDVLIRLAGGRTIYGGDANNRYESEYGFTEEHAYTQNYDFCNCASVMYRIRKGTEDLSNIGAYYTDWGAFFKYVTNMPVVYVNTVNYIDGDSGMKIINQGVDAVYTAMAPEMIRHWKRIKNGCLTTPQLAGVLDGAASTYRFDSVAPMLGIRETWRTMCERMLNENSLYVQVSAEETADNDLDKTIAVGSYIVDLLNDPYITAEQREYIDSHRKRYAVPYGSIVPKGFTNVLVASRGAGFTHIAASSFRLTKNMMQLGWAAGWAALYKIENSLSDFRDVDISTVQSADYASITQMIQKVLS